MKFLQKNKDTFKFVLSFIIFLFILIGVNLSTGTVEANYNSEYAYYGVDNFRDYARAIRKETCYRALNEALEDVTEKQVIHCATANTLITAIESANMKSRRCVEDNNCM